MQYTSAPERCVLTPMMHARPLAATLRSMPTAHFFNCLAGLYHQEQGRYMRGHIVNGT
jgi:hypothetical protein